MQREIGNETRKIQDRIKSFLKGKGIDIGCGEWPLDYRNLDTLDLALEVKPTILGRAEKIPMPDETYDFVYSSHCLEHVKCPKRVLKEWLRILKPGGLLILFLPHKYFYPNVRDKEGNAGHWYDFKPEDIILMLKKIGQTYLIETEIVAEQVIPRWQNKIEYPLKKEFNQYSFYLIACKKKKKFFESFFIESWLNRIPKIKPALRNKLKAVPILGFTFRILKRYFLNPNLLFHYIKAKAYCLGNSSKKIEIAGHSIKLLTKSIEEYDCANDKLHEFPFIKYIISHLKTDDVVYDIGAFIGLHSMFFAKKARHIHSFEPSGSNFKRLVENIKYNNFDNITAWKYALSSENRMGKLYTKKHKLYQKGSLRQIEDDKIFSEDVKITTVDEQALKTVPPTVLKIDVEGAEYEVFKGAIKTLQLHFPLIFLELHQPDQLKSFDTSPPKVLGFLNKIGYKIKYIGPRNKIFAYKKS